jgi:hypothetical protein
MHIKCYRNRFQQVSFIGCSSNMRLFMYFSNAIEIIHLLVFATSLND